MKAISFIRQPGASARYRVRFTKSKGKIIEFVVQLETERDGKWVPVVRYDTAHGVAHRDRYRADGFVHRHEKLAASDFNTTLTLAIQDVRQNWKKLIRAFEEVSG